MASEREKLQPHEFLVCWETAEESWPAEVGPDPTYEVVTYSLANNAGTYRLAVQRCGDFEEMLAAVERADGLTRAYSPTARLHLSYIHRKAMEMGMNA